MPKKNSVSQKGLFVPWRDWSHNSAIQPLLGRGEEMHRRVKFNIDFLGVRILSKALLLLFSNNLSQIVLTVTSSRTATLVNSRGVYIGLHGGVGCWVENGNQEKHSPRATDISSTVYYVPCGWGLEEDRVQSSGAREKTINFTCGI